MDDFKGTPGPWVADIRGGCAAIYPERLASDTNGCHRGDSRNIAYSDKGANFNGRHWEIDPAVAHDFMVMAAAPELLEALQIICFFEDISSAQREIAEAAIAKALGESQ